MKPTTPLLPPSPTPLYSLALEEEFYQSNSEAVMLQFTVNVLKIQYWESVSLCMQQQALR